MTAPWAQFKIKHRGWALVFAVMSLTIAFGASVRIHGALSAPNFDTSSPVGMLRADPALIFYLVERVIDAGGGVPDDFDADPRLEHPATTDIPATFTVGQEFIIAWLRPFFDPSVPLHVFCVWVMGIISSFAVVGVFGLAFELTGKLRWASVAAILYVLIPANYRTIGFVLIREDLSLPLWSIHIWWLARAIRVQTRTAAVIATIFGLATAATWHAGGFILALEMGCLLLWFFRTGSNPLRARGATSALLLVAVFSLLIPALRGKGFCLSIPVKIMAALWIAALWSRTATRSHRSTVGITLAMLGITTFLGSVILSGPVGLGHVFEIIKTKILHLGSLPLDPSLLSFEARLMWQGPFASMSMTELHSLLGATLWASSFALGTGLWSFVRRGDRELQQGLGPLAVISAFAATALFASLLFQRLQVLPGLLCPVLAAVSLRHIAKANWALGILSLTILLQAISFSSWYRDLRLTWYDPPQLRAELRSLIEAIQERVPENEPIACDFMNSAAILAHTGHPIIAQPKWESRRSLDRAKNFLMTFNHGTTEDVREMVFDLYDCEYAVFDRHTLWGLSRYVTGIPNRVLAPLPGTAASVFCSDDTRTLRYVPGFRAIYWSPSSVIDPGGAPTGWFRLYQVGPR